jgi:hypothetical protein
MEENKSLQTQNASTNLAKYSQGEQNKVMQVLASFGEDYQVQVFNRFNKAVGIEKAVAEKAPTFHDVTDFYGEQATLFWLRYHIADTFLFVGIYDTSSKYQIQQTAELILQHEIYGQLTLAEFLNFLQRFKQGRYDKIYQSNHPNPQEFLRCLQPFWNELCYQRGKQEEKERLDKLSEQRNSGQHISYEDWCKETGKEPNPLLKDTNNIKIQK